MCSATTVHPSSQLHIISHLHGDNSLLHRDPLAQQPSRTTIYKHRNTFARHCQPIYTATQLPSNDSHTQRLITDETPQQRLASPIDLACPGHNGNADQLCQPIWPRRLDDTIKPQPSISRIEDSWQADRHEIGRGWAATNVLWLCEDIRQASSSIFRFAS